MFRYGSLEWHTPYFAGGKPHGPATAGVNARNKLGRDVGFNVSNDPANFIDFELASMSNVGVPGLFVYSLN